MSAFQEVISIAQGDTPSKTTLDTTQIPVHLTSEEFEEFIFPHLSLPKRGPRCKIGYHKLFNYILKVLHTGMQWSELPIDKTPEGHAEIHYTGIFKVYARWVRDGSIDKVFQASVKRLEQHNKLDLRVLHGDGSNTVAKKGALALATVAINIKKARRPSPLLTTRGM